MSKKTFATEAERVAYEAGWEDARREIAAALYKSAGIAATQGQIFTCATLTATAALLTPS